MVLCNPLIIILNVLWNTRTQIDEGWIPVGEDLDKGFDGGLIRGG